MADSEKYIGTPNGIVLCVDNCQGHAVKGRFYHAYSKSAVGFENEDQLMFGMEEFFDSINYPYPANTVRSFAETKRKGKKQVNQDDSSWSSRQLRMNSHLKKREKVMEDQELLNMHGDMGSFIVRTILAKHPDSGITGCVICGTAWQPAALMAAAGPVCKLMCRNGGDRKPSEPLKKMMFGSYNKRVEHLRTENDWLTRDDRVVDAYNADPLCGFTATAGLYRDMLTGIAYVQKQETLNAMNRHLPILFVAGSADPVGAYGKGVEQAANAFRASGMEDVQLKLYPMCRHEILNEINNGQIWQDIQDWIREKAGI
jgi:alpha-beta hydrolase superfamily lysophospholipase